MKREKLRARELGLPFDGVPGPDNAITDVQGVLVGYCTITEGKDSATVGPQAVQTGVTAILPRGHTEVPTSVFAGQHTLNGNGEMTGCHWINDAGYFLGPICITNTHSVGIAHHAVTKWSLKQYSAFFKERHRFIMPVVAETYDGLLNDINGQHVREEHVLAAIADAKDGAIAEGNVGGGNGMVSYEFKGGTGTSSRRVDLGAATYTLGVLVQANFGLRQDLTILGVPVGRALAEGGVFQQIDEKEFGSIIVIAATDAPLLPAQLNRIARRAALGMGRTGTIGCHSSGDLFLAFSTASNPLSSGDTSFVSKFPATEESVLDAFYRATRDATEEAIVNALLAADTSHSVRPAGIIVNAIDQMQLISAMEAFRVHLRPT